MAASGIVILAAEFAYQPKSNIAFWNTKFAGNIGRDARVRGELEKMGWSVLTIWECETRQPDELSDILMGHLGNARR